MKPWEKYQQKSAGPWEKYGKQAQVEQAQGKSDSDFMGQMMDKVTPLAPIAGAGPDGTDLQWYDQNYNAVTPPSNAPSNMAVLGESFSREMPSNILGTPGDLLNLGLNTIGSGVATLRGDETYTPVEGPLPSSEYIKENLFGEVANRDDYTRGQRIMGNMASLGGEALTGGLGLASKAKSMGKAPSMIKDLIEPYLTRPVAQPLTDAMTGAGAGGGLSIAQEQEWGPIGTMLSMIAGGAGTTGMAKVAETNTPFVGRNAQAKRLTQLPDGSMVRRDAVNDASQVANSIVTDKTQAIRNIDQSIQDADSVGIPNPTTGPASGDIGLSMLEVRQRGKNPQPFVEKDQAVRTGVAERFNEFRNPEADVQAPQRRADSIIDQRVGEKQATIDDLQTTRDTTEQELLALQKQEGTIKAPIEARRGAEGRASAQLDEQVRSVLDEKTTVKNEAFDQAAEGAFMDVEGLLQTVKDVDAELGPLSPPEAKLPSWISEKLQALIPKPGTLEGPGSTAGLVPAKAVLELRRDLKTAADGARARGGSGYMEADQLNKLRKRINETIDADPRFKDANTNYKEEYAPFFGGKYGKEYRDTVQRGDGTGKSDVENIASFFLNKTSTAADDLARIIDVAPDKAAANDAVETYFDAMLAKKTLNPNTVRNYIADNTDILPDNLKKKYEGLIKELMGNETAQGGVLQDIRKLGRDIRNAEKDLSSTKRSLETGPLGRISKYDPDKYVGDIMGAKDRIKQIEQVVKEIGDDEEALDGFKEATVRWLQKKVKGTAASDTDIPDTDLAGRPILYSKLTNTLDDNREALSKIFSPEEMNTLNRMHRIMSRQGNLSRRATTGSDTMEKLSQNERQVMDLIEGALRLKFGMIKGGGIMATGKKLRRNIFGESKGALRADEILTKMAFDPKVAKHVLEITPLKVDNGKWITDFNKLLSARETVKNMDNTDEE
jgi:hypothetical protein